MAFLLSCSSSSAAAAAASAHNHRHHPLPSSTPSPQLLSWKSLLSRPSKPVHPPIRVSLQDPSPLTSHDPLPEQPHPKPAAAASAPTFKNSVWVNPNSPRAARLRQSSSDFRYARLTQLAASLSSRTSPPEVAETLAASGGPEMSEQDAVIVLNNMDNPGSAALVLRWFLQHLEVNKEAILYNVTLKAMRKCRSWDMAESLLLEMLERGVRPDNITFSTAISCARLCNLPDKAVEWFERMPEFGCAPDDVTYSAMIDAYGRSGKVERALELYDRARTEKWRIDAVTFSTVIRVYGSSGNFDGALNVFEEMKAVGVSPNVVTYNTLLDAMGRAGRPWQVKTIYKEMTGRGLLPTRTTYAALLRAYGKARYSEDALGVYREMKEKGMELNVVLYNTLLAMCADMGLVDEAFEIFEDMKRATNGCSPDSWTYSSLITIYSCSGHVSEAENILNQMQEAGIQPNIFVLTSLIQCYGKAKLTDDIVRTFERVSELGITPDDRFCGCLLNVMTQTPKQELGKIIGCIERANGKLGSLVKMLVEENVPIDSFKDEAEELFHGISKEVKKAYCNCLIDVCINLDLLEKACILLDLALRLEIYTALQSKSSTQWSLHVKSLSLGAALTALHVWMNDLSRALEDGEELPPVLGIHTGHGKHKYSERGLAAVFQSHLRDLNAPFHESPDKAGWFLTTKVAAESWLESRSSPELVAS